MNAHQIIAELYTSKEVDDSLRGWFDGGIVEDVKQDLFEILLVSDPEQIVAMYQRKQLKYWVVRIIINLSRQERNVVFKTYRTSFLRREINKDFTCADVVDDHDVEYEDTHEECLRADADDLRKLEAFGKLSYYHQELFKLWVELGSQQKVSDLTTIPLRSIKKALSNARKEINEILARDADSNT